MKSIVYKAGLKLTSLKRAGIQTTNIANSVVLLSQQAVLPLPHYHQGFDENSIW